MRQAFRSGRFEKNFLRRVTRAGHEPCYLRTCRVTSLTNNGSNTKAATPCRWCHPRISLSFYVSLSFPSRAASLLRTFQKRQLFTLRRRALRRANGRSSLREKWTRGCLMAPRPVYRFIRTDVVFHERCAPSGRDAIEQNVLDVRNVGYFPVRRAIRFPLSFFFFLEKKNVFPYALQSRYLPARIRNF